jgi:hypothetical protein
LLPVYGDLGGVLALDEFGEVHGWGHDSEHPPEPVSEAGWKLLALTLAAKQFPALRSLEPIRPTEAPSCGRCPGTGLLVLGELSVRCGDCYGLGWHAT